MLAAIQDSNWARRIGNLQPSLFQNIKRRGWVSDVIHWIPFFEVDAAKDIGRLNVKQADITRKEEFQIPFEENLQFIFDSGQLIKIGCTPHEPAKNAGHFESKHFPNRAVMSQRRHLAKRLESERLRRRSSADTQQIFTKERALAHGKLSSRRRGSSAFARNGRTIARSPKIRNAFYLHRRLGRDPASFVR